MPEHLLQNSSVDILHTYPNIETAVGALNDNHQQLFAIKATSLVLYITTRLEDEGLLHATDAVAEGLVRWNEDEQHGVIHSYHVFEGAKTLRSMNPAYSDISDDDLFIRAVLHDLGQFLPLVGSDGTPIDRPKVDKSKLHAPLMHRTIMLWGQVLHLHEPETLARDILHHDYSYRHPSEEGARTFQDQLSRAGKLFVDADRFAGAGPIDDEQITRKTIERNRTGSLGRWYIFRDDLTAENRLSWEIRTGGFFDGASAIFQEFLGFPDYLANTPEGKMIANNRKVTFKNDIVSYYTDAYRSQRPRLEEAWEQQTVAIGVKEKDGILRLSDVLSAKLFALPFQEAMDQLVHTPVPEKNTRNGRSYYGYSLLHDGSWYDPSILRFLSEEALRDALLSSMVEYEKTFAKKIS